MANLIVLLIVVLIIGLACFTLYRNKKKGNTCCGCSVKPGSPSCHCKTDKK